MKQRTSFSVLEPGTLPAPISPLIGREREVELAVEAITKGGARLLTLTGPGGVGKTRLSIEIAQVLRDRAALDALFVPLAALDGSDRLGSTLARSLVSTSGASDELATAARLVGDRPLVLVLDNFEHLLDAAPLVTQLLRTCAGLRVIVTSRTRLRATGEHVLVVDPLAIPQLNGEQNRVDVILASPAVRLFLARAHAASGDFRLTDETAHTVAAICRRLDGLPLAIELAAARLARISLPDLKKRLDGGIRELVDGPIDQDERLRTMCQAIA